MYSRQYIYVTNCLSVIVAYYSKFIYGLLKQFSVVVGCDTVYVLVADALTQWWDLHYNLNNL